MTEVRLNDITLPQGMLKELSLETLKDISAQDEATFYEFFQGLNLSDVREARSRVEKQTEKNRHLAVENCELEPKFQKAKERLTAKVIEAAELKSEYNQCFEELKKLQSKNDNTAIIKELQELLKTTDKCSEELGDSYLSGKSEMSVDEFSEEFLKLRTQYWLRKVKAEKMEDLLKNRQPRAAPRPQKVGGPPPQPTGPYRAPFQPPNPMHSLPVAGPSHYPPDRRVSDPAPAPAPYPSGPSPMPQPHLGHPFPPAAFTPYNPQHHPSPHYPNYRPPHPPYSSRPPQYGYR